MFRASTLLLPALSALGLAIGSAAQAEEARCPDRFLGSYEFAGGDTEAQALQSTLDAMVDDFNVLLRGIARRRLTRSLQVPDRIEIESGDDGALLTVVGSPDFPTDAAYESDALILRQKSFEGFRETRFHLSPDGAVLVMRVVTQSALLPRMLDYELTFERSSRADADASAAIEAGS